VAQPGRARRPPAPSRELGPESPADDATSRRSVLQLLGASAALATLAAASSSRREDPAVHEAASEVTPENPLHYATASVIDGRRHRPPGHRQRGPPDEDRGQSGTLLQPGRPGSTEQAELLRLYDPQRLKVVQHKSQPRALRDFLQGDRLQRPWPAQQAGRGLRFLMEAQLVAADRLPPSAAARDVSSREVLRVERDPAAADLRRRAACVRGRVTRLALDLSRASVLLSLDSDLLAALPGTLPAMADWARSATPGRRAGPALRGRVEPHRHRDERGPPAPAEADRDPALRARAARAAGRAGPGALAVCRACQRFTLPPESAKFADALAKDLVKAGRGALVSVGRGSRPPCTPRRIAINTALGSACVALARPVLHDMDAGPRALQQLAEEVRGGRWTRW